MKFSIKDFASKYERIRRKLIHCRTNDISRDNPSKIATIVNKTFSKSTIETLVIMF